MTNLSSIQKKYKGMWIAIKEDFSSVIAASRNAKTTFKKAQKLGYKKPTLFKVPQHIIPYVGIV